MADAIGLIDMKFKAKHRNLTRELGRAPTARDKGYWELSDWYRREVEMKALVSPTVEQRVDMREVQVDEEGVEWVTSEDRKCEVCWVKLRKKKGQRGRWPKVCEGCRDGHSDDEGDEGETP